MGSGPPNDLTSPSLPLSRPFSQIKSQSEILVLRCQHLFPGDTIQSITYFEIDPKWIPLCALKPSLPPDFQTHTATFLNSPRSSLSLPLLKSNLSLVLQTLPWQGSLSLPHFPFPQQPPKSWPELSCTTPGVLSPDRVLSSRLFLVSLYSNLSDKSLPH